MPCPHLDILFIACATPRPHASHASHISPTPRTAIHLLDITPRVCANAPTLNCRHNFPKSHLHPSFPAHTVIASAQMHINTSVTTRKNSTEGAKAAITATQK